MPALHKISTDFYESPYSLIALHCALEDYTLAYWLNRCLKTKFKKKKDLDLNTGAQFSVYDWQDTVTDSYWTLLSNKYMSTDYNLSQNLFGEAPLEKRQHLVPEHKSVDFFLKIEDEGYLNTVKLLEQLKQMPKIVMPFVVNKEQLKSKNNLIF